MRPSASRLVAVAVALLAVAALVDALRGEKTGERLEPEARAEGKVRSTLPTDDEPPIPGRRALSGALRTLGVEGVLYLMDRDCRLRLLRLPELRWTPGTSGPSCSRNRPIAWAPDGRLGAFEQGEAVVVFALGDSWEFRFQGSAPAFRPDGVLTFIRDGGLHSWDPGCQPNVRRVSVGSDRPAERCERVILLRSDVEAALRGRGLTLSAYSLAAVAWLSASEAAVVVHGRWPDEAVLAVLEEGGRARAVFPAFGTRLGRLEASPGRGYVAVTAGSGADALLFDSALNVRSFPREVTAIRDLSWSADERWTAAAAGHEIHIFRTDRPESGAVSLPVPGDAVDWR